MRCATTLTLVPIETMSSFRNRILSLAMDGQSASLQPHFEDAASVCHTKKAAMAFGYLLGREDATKEEPFPGPSIHERVITVIEQCADGEFDQEYAADLVFSLIYKWLDKAFEDEDFDPHVVNGEYLHPSDESTRYVLAEAFQPFVQPGVINPPLPSKEKA